MFRFNLLALLLWSSLSLSFSDTFQPVSNSSSGSVNSFVPLSKSEPVIPVCQYNNSYQSPFADDSSKCSNIAANNQGSIQYLKVDQFEKEFSQAMLSLPAVQRFLGMLFPGSKMKDVFYKLDYKLFKDIGHEMPDLTAYSIAQNVGLYDFYPLSIYFKHLGNTIAKFLLAENIGLGSDVVRCYAYFLQKAMQSPCNVSEDELYQALLDGLVNFVESLGFNFLEKTDLIVQLFTNELLTFVKS